MIDREGAAATRVLLALIAVHQRDGRATVRAVARQAGLKTSTTHNQLGYLRRRGLVAWDDGANGSLRPLLTPVATGVPA